MKIGIWAIFENGKSLGTIKPNEGIGVYLFNIIQEFNDKSNHIKIFCLKTDKDLFENKFGAEVQLIDFDVLKNKNKSDKKNSMFQFLHYCKNIWVNFVSITLF